MCIWFYLRFVCVYVDSQKYMLKIGLFILYTSLILDFRECDVFFCVFLLSCGSVDCQMFLSLVIFALHLFGGIVRRNCRVLSAFLFCFVFFLFWDSEFWFFLVLHSTSVYYPIPYIPSWLCRHVLWLRR